MSFEERVRTTLERVLATNVPEVASEGCLEIFGAILSNIGKRSVFDKYQLYLKYDPHNEKSQWFKEFLDHLGDINSMDEMMSFLTHSLDTGIDFNSSRPSLQKLIQPYYYLDTLEDTEILKYLSFTLLGSTSNLFPFDQEGKIALPLNINYGTSGTLHKLLEPAILYKHLNSVPMSQNSSIQNLFTTELRNYLSQYVNYINFCFNRNDLTLLKLYTLLVDEIVKLRFFNYLVSLKCSNSEFLSYLYRFTGHGDSLVREIAQNLFNKTVVPYYDIILQWITRGELSKSETGVFFVDLRDEKVESLDNFVLSSEKIPEFFPLSIGEKLYQIGKTVYFLTKYCNDLKWLNDFNKRFKSYEFELAKFPKIVEVEYAQVINHSSIIIYRDFHLIEDIKGINEIMLRKGDHIDAMIHKGWDILNEPSNALTSHKLNRLLVDSINDSSLKNYPKEMLNKIDARLLNHGSIGFESFTLDYHFTLEFINNHSIKEYLRLFNFLFKLRRINYMLSQSWLESTNFKDINSYVKKLKVSMKRGNQLLRQNDKMYMYAMKNMKKFNIVSFNMVKFVNSITDFFNYQVIELNYQSLMHFFQHERLESDIARDVNGVKRLTKLKPNLQFLEKINVSTFKPVIESHEFKDLNLDQIGECHEQYIKSISRNRLLDTKNERSRGKYSNTFFIHQLSNLLSLIFKFVMVNEEFYVNLLELLNTTNTIEPDEQLLQSLQKRSSILTENLYQLLYKFKGCSDVFTNDLLQDNDPLLKHLGSVLSR